MQKRLKVGKHVFIGESDTYEGIDKNRATFDYIHGNHYNIIEADDYSFTVEGDTEEWQYKWEYNPMSLFKPLNFLNYAEGIGKLHKAETKRSVQKKVSRKSIP